MQKYCYTFKSSIPDNTWGEKSSYKSLSNKGHLIDRKTLEGIYVHKLYSWSYQQTQYRIKQYLGTANKKINKYPK